MRKMKSKKGFTLIEMLIVVGIIGILVAVSIPMVNSSLEKARVATDLANERSAKSAALVIYMTGDIKSSEAGAVAGEASAEKIVLNGKPTAASGYKCYYDANKGIITTTIPTGYGKCADHNGGYILVGVDKKSGVVYLDWSTGFGTSHLTADVAAGS